MSASNEQPAGQIIAYQAEDEASTREGKGGSAGGWDGYRGRMTWQRELRQDRPLPGEGLNDALRQQGQ